MGTKLNPGKFDCYANALPDEPMFTLLARDPSAPSLLEMWANHRSRQIRSGDRPQSDRDMVDEARQCAYEMKKWRRENDGKWRVKKT
jgi:hypothetical protein